VGDLERASLEAGAELGPYQIVAVIGVGGMGEVYRARDRRLGRDVAVKVLPEAVRTDAERLRRFEQEARAIAALQHPNILAVFDVGEHEETRYLVTELLEGRTLDEHMGQRPLSSERALEIAVQVARGLAAAHDRGIVHRDLKPANLFVTRDGVVKILDFGLAKSIPVELARDSTLTAGAHTESGAVLGTAGYMSPEQVRGLSADTRSDLFAFGAILYEMLAGRRAFDAATSVEKAFAILKNEPPPLPVEVPAALERVVRRCLEKDPARRFHSAADLAFALGEVSARPTSPPRERRRPAWRMVAALAALALATWAITRLLAQPSPRPSAATWQRITFRRGTVDAARFSPDGRSVLFSVAHDGGPFQVFAVSPGKPEPRLLTGDGVRLLSISRREEMALLLDDPTRLSYGTRSTLARAPLSGGAPRAVMDDVVSADWSPDGEQLAVIRKRDGRATVEFPPEHVIYQTENRLESLRVSPDGQRLAFVEYPMERNMRGQVMLAQAASGAHRLSRTWGQLTGLGWSPHGDEVWFTATDGEDCLDIRAVDLAGRERLVTSTPALATLHDVRPDGRALVETAQAEERIALAVAGAKEERDLSWLQFSRVTALSNDGSLLLFNEAATEGMTAAYLRKTDGSPAIRLGIGWSWALSPDGRSVLHSPREPHDELVLLPTGAGEPRSLPRGPIALYDDADFFPDGKRALVIGREPGKRTRFYVQDLAGGPPRALAAEGFRFSPHPIAPDGRSAAVLDEAHHPFLLPLDGGEPRRLPGFADGDLPIQWSSDGKSLYVRRVDRDHRLRVLRYEVASASLSDWKVLPARDRAGQEAEDQVVITPDGASYAVGTMRHLSNIYIVDGLR
jgi:dipeptidyl aminopeptidase/acylaminoacyl peptidase